MPQKMSSSFDTAIDLLEKLNFRPMQLEQAQAGRLRLILQCPADEGKAGVI
jgi:hypothetical protein